MAVQTTVTGVVLSSMPIDEADKRVVLLTREMGRVSCFARGAKRMNSPLSAKTRTFAFGTFTLNPGKNAFSLSQAEISDYFEELVKDIEKTAYGYYFLELAGSFARENADESELVSLLYFSLKALGGNTLPAKLVQRVFEIKLLAINGFCPDLSVCAICKKPVKEGFFRPDLMQAVDADCMKEGAYPLSRSALYTFRFIRENSGKRLFSFTLSDEVLKEVEAVTEFLLTHTWDREPESRKMIRVLTGEG